MAEKTTSQKAEAKKTKAVVVDSKKAPEQAAPATSAATQNPTGGRLYRLPQSGKVAGVCAGLAMYLDLDVTLLRIIFVVLTLASGGVGVLIYIIMALVLPVSEGNQSNKTTTASSSKNIEQRVEGLSQEVGEKAKTDYVRNLLGAGLMLFGAWLLLVEFFPEVFRWDWSLIWPALLIVLGLLLLAKGRS